jgi:hypothetical protein
VLRAILVTAVSAIILTFSVATQAEPILFTAELTGPNESPPNASTATGTTTVESDPVAHTIHVQASFSGLTSPTTAAHIHCCTAVPFTGAASPATTVPSFPGFPLGVTSGSFDETFDMTLASSYNPAFIAANGGTADLAEDALFAGMLAGESYLNIHTTVFPV